MSAAKQLLTIDQVSQQTGFAKKTLYNWISDRKIPYMKVNGNVRFDQEVLNSWLDKRHIKQRIA